MSTNKKHPGPPRLATRLLHWFLREDLKEEVTGDLQESYEFDISNSGYWRANWKYWRQVFLYARPFATRNLVFNNSSAEPMMIRNYLKTSARAMSRNKLFTFINTCGLAVGMSVGLLLIAFLIELRSYDRHHEHGDRIYRVTSGVNYDNGRTERFATTSVGISRLLRENVSGIEDVGLINTEFGADAKVSDNVFPLEGVYADPAFLRMFTFVAQAGDLNTALEKPFSIILTATTARKLFGDQHALGESILIGADNYLVTAVIEDVPFHSHLHFECLVSYATLETQQKISNRDQLSDDVWERNYAYVMLSRNAAVDDVLESVRKLNFETTDRSGADRIQIELQSLYTLMIGERLSNSIVPPIPPLVIWGVGALALIVIVSACFNYTNLSVARATRRLKEVGLRKVVGARPGQVKIQFLVESIMMSLSALLVSLVLFVLARPHVVTLAPEILSMVRLELSAQILISFGLFAFVVGIMAGVFPSIMLSRVESIQALKNSAAVKIGHFGIRKVLIVGQFTVTLILLTATVVGHRQYQDMLAFDLGFDTGNVLNIELQKNKPDLFIEKLRAIPGVVDVSQSRIVTSVGNAWGAYVRSSETSDSVLVFTNIVDEHYLPLHRYALLAGSNFIARPQTVHATSEVILNERALKTIKIGKGDPGVAVGQQIFLNDRPLTIVGVIKDFHYGKLDDDIHPVAFTYLTPDAFLTKDGRDGVINVRLQPGDPAPILAQISGAWKKFDPVHEFQSKFYSQQIEEAYAELSAIVQFIGVLSFMAIWISFLGLLGMVVFMTETRTKEISIRRVLGASPISLIFLLGRVFLMMLLIAGSVAVPFTYLFFEYVVLIRFPFHNPIGLSELLVGMALVVFLAAILIGSQTLLTILRNPAVVLRSE